jgi:AcrR family transcriptional regulator
MSEVAAAAGVARATVYRYFPSRQKLLDELAEVAVRDAGRRLAAARIDQLDTRAGVERAVRALVEVGDVIVVLARESLRPEPELFERELAAPLRRLFERGQERGELRTDASPAWLADALVGLVVGVLRSSVSMGREDAIAATTGVFLDGARGGPRDTGTR